MSTAATDRKPRAIPHPTVTSTPLWSGGKNGKLMLQYDRKAGTYQFFPRPLGLHTGSADVEWREASGRGKLYAWTLVHVPARGFEDVAPYVVAAVELDEGVRVMARLAHVDPKTLKPGFRVRVDWEPAGADGVMYVFRPEG